MKFATIVADRFPVLCVLLGLLFIAIGLYVGFDHGLSFVAIGLGLFFVAFGLALFVFQMSSRRSSSAATRLSPNFISVGSEGTINAAGAADEPTDRSQTG